MFIRSNLGDEETTKVNYLTFIGTPVQATNMNDFKRVTQPHTFNDVSVNQCDAGSIHVSVCSDLVTAAAFYINFVLFCQI